MTLTINNAEKKDLNKYVSKPDMGSPSRAYVLSVKADALRFSSLYREAVSKYLNAILIERDNIDCYYGLALCYKQLKDYDKAIDTLEKALLHKDDDFRLYYELGIVYLMAGEPCFAMKNLIRAIQLEPENLNAQIQLAIAHEFCEEEDIALLIYNKIIENNPEYLKAYNHKSALLMEMGEYQEASVVFRNLLKLNPEFYRAYLGIGICFDKMKRPADALRYYKKFLLKKPNSHHSLYIKRRMKDLKEIRSENNHLRLI